MPSDFERMCRFIQEHHLLSLATVHHNQPYNCAAFYSFNAKEVCFVMASDPKTQHIRNVLHHPYVALSIALETHDIGTIQGVQCRGRMHELESTTLEWEYFQKFPYAKIMRPLLWCIRVDHIKFTDNRLGFGVKLTWTRAL